MRKYLLLLLLAVTPAFAQYTTVTGTHIKNAAGLLLPSGAICFQPADSRGNPLAFNAGGGDTVTSAAVCRDVTAGVIMATYKTVSLGALQLADVTLSNPQNVCYQVRVVDNATGQVVVGKPKTQGYDCFQPSGPSYDFNAFVPSGISTALSVTGPVGPTGPTGATGATGAPGTASANSGLDQTCTTTPANPAAGHTIEWCDSTTKIRAIKDDAGNNVAPTGRPNDKPAINVLTNCAGIVGDNTADERTAFAACKALYPGRELFFPPTNNSASINNPHYFFGGQVDISGISISGMGGCWAGLCGTVIRFPRGSNGFVNSNGYGQIHDIAWTGSDLVSASASVTELAKLTAPARSGTAMEEYDQRLDNLVASTDVSRTSGVTTITIHNTPLMWKVNGIIKVTIPDDTSFNGTFYVDSGSQLAGGVSSITYAQTGAGDVALFHPQTSNGQSIITVATTGPGGDGLLVSGGVVNIERVFIHGFSGNCIKIQGNGVVTDDWTVQNSKVYGCHEQGLMSAGTDASAGATYHLMAYANLFYGIFDIGFLGNSHFLPQLSYNHMGAFGITNYMIGGGTTTTITSCTRASGVVTCTFSTPPVVQYRVGSGIFLAGMSDSTFNARAGSASGFVATVPDTTHVTFTQPGYNLANGTATGGTGRLISGAEFAVAVAADGGSFTIGRLNSAGNFSVFKAYVEGGQATDRSGGSIRLGGGVVLQGLHSGDTIDTADGGFWNPSSQYHRNEWRSANHIMRNFIDGAALDIGMQVGLTSSSANQHITLGARRWDGAWIYNLHFSPCTEYNRFMVQDGTNWPSGLSRFYAKDSQQCAGNGDSGANSRGTGRFAINMDGGPFTNTNLGTGGFQVGRGTTTPTQLWKVDPTVGETMNGTANNGDGWNRNCVNEAVTLSTSGTTTDSAANLLPANAVITGVTYRINTTITTATNFSIGDATTAARFCGTQSTLTAGTTGTCIAQVDQTGAAGPKQTSAAKVRFTTTGTPGAGVVRVTVCSATFTPPTS